MCNEVSGADQVEEGKIYCRDGKGSVGLWIGMMEMRLSEEWLSHPGGFVERP